MAFSITRSIGVDYGHRVMTHGSKCKSIHGHRGTIEVTCVGPTLHRTGEQSDMVLDFGFLKDAMLNVIDKSIDHGFVASIDDHELLRHFLPQQENTTDVLALVRSSFGERGYWLSTDHRDKVRTLLDSKLYIIPYIPTSERLAEHFFGRLKDPIQQQSNGVGELTNLRFWETPNCYSDFPGFAQIDS